MADQVIRQYGVTDYTQRVIKDVKPPAGFAADGNFYAKAAQGGWIPNIPFLRTHLYREGRLTEDQIKFILYGVKEILVRESNVLRLQSPLTVCGDVHGQFYDLINFMTPDLGGNPLKTDYLFLGDYVDRGYFSVECCLWLFAIKMVQPSKMHLLRGNHESRHLTNYFTFKLECKRKYSEEIYNLFIEVFKTLPLAAIIDNKYFCVHGGISPDLVLVEDIDKINRFEEPSRNGLFCDLLWSDPAPPGMDDVDGPGFLQNQIRGCSYYYTHKAVCNFLKQNNLQSMIRAHEAQEHGYAMFPKTPDGYPSIISIFSAPNYCDAYGNKGAVLLFEGGKLTIRWFYSVSHPFWLQNLADVFAWSLPFVAEKSLDMLQAILDTLHPEESESEDVEMSSADDDLLPIGRKGLVMSHVYGILREDGPEGASEFRNLPVELSSSSLSSAAEEATKMIPDFDHARTSDILNERMPPKLVDPTEADDYYNLKSEYASLEKSAKDLGQKASMGTTFASSPSTRKRSVEVTKSLIREAARLVGTENREAKIETKMPKLMEAITQLKALRAKSGAAREMAKVVRRVEDE